MWPVPASHSLTLNMNVDNELRPAIGKFMSGTTKHVTSAAGARGTPMNLKTRDPLVSSVTALV